MNNNIEIYKQQLQIYKLIYEFLYGSSLLERGKSQSRMPKIDLKDPKLLLASLQVEQINKLFHHSLLNLFARDSSLHLDGKLLKILSTKINQQDLNYILNYREQKNIQSKELLLLNLTWDSLINALQHNFFRFEEDTIQALITSKLKLTTTNLNSSTMESTRLKAEFNNILLQQLQQLFPLVAFGLHNNSKLSA